MVAASPKALKLYSSFVILLQIRRENGILRPVTLDAASEHLPALDTLRAFYAADAAPGMPKHRRLQNAILAAIARGAWRPGDQVPPERQITRAIALSLGTVQRALGGLVAEGAIVREHGRGTFVSGPRRLDELWQFRFSRPGTRGLLPVSAEILERRHAPSGGPWADALGDDPKGFLEIDRLIRVDGALTCYSRFHLGMTRFAALHTLPIRSFDAGNLKIVLRDRFAAPTLAISQRVRVAPLGSDICRAIEVAPDTVGMILEAVGFTYANMPLSFQTVWIPPSAFHLDMSHVRWDDAARAAV
jgi:DNA-binding GntR family transcriptional regulator